VRQGGTKVVLVPLPPAVGRAIDAAIGTRASRPILLNNRGARMDRHAATRRLWRLADAADVPISRPHPHMLRHAFVTTMLDAGVDLRDVQIAARHADPRTTMRYDKSWVLHQPGEKPQVTRTPRCWNSVSDLWIAAVRLGMSLERSLLMVDPPARRSRRLTGSLQAHRGREGL
jgi:Phage integrase family